MDPRGRPYYWIGSTIPVGELEEGTDISAVADKHISMTPLHLDLTHNGRAADKEAMYLKTNQYHIAQFAYLTERMKAISEGETSLLDNSILMLTSSLFDGDAHSAEQLPILLTGKGGGRPGTTAYRVLSIAPAPVLALPR